MKKCSVCKEQKQLCNYYKDVSHRDGYSSRCKLCSTRIYKTRQNLTPCEICGSTNRLGILKCKECKSKVAILCGYCSIGFGLLKYSVSILNSAISYLGEEDGARQNL